MKYYLIKTFNATLRRLSKGFMCFTLFAQSIQVKTVIFNHTVPVP